jgi:Flp pilus assembly protein TadD
MKKRWLIGCALVAAAILVFLLATGLKRVPQGSEGLLVSNGGTEDLYEPGWHVIRPLSGDFIVYPAGDLAMRYPRTGDIDVMLRNGSRASVSFTFRLRIPPGTAKTLYSEFGKDFTAGLEQTLYDIIEIEAANVSAAAGGAAPAGFAHAVAEELRESLSALGISILSAKIESWKLAEGASVAAAADIAAKPLRKIVFIGVDGAEWQIINPLIKAGALPNLKRIVEGGAFGPLRSLEPMLSPLIWTTMATGKLPEEHGILNFTVDDPQTGKKIPITRRYRKVDAFWNMMSDYGRTVDIIGWLATYPAESINGMMVSDRVGYLAFASSDPESSPGSGAISPPVRYSEIMDLIVGSGDVSFAEMKRFMHIDETTLDKSRAATFDPLNPISNMILIYATALSYRNIALHLLEKDRPDFLGVYFELVDAAGHLFMPYAPPRQADVSDEDYRIFKDAVTEAYILQDRIIGEMLEWCDENTIVMIASDHGFKTGDARLKAGAEIAGGHAAEWHQIDGVVCLYGNGIIPGYRIEDASVIDIAPTILALAGFPRVEDMPGNVLEDAFELPFRESLNPESVATLERDRPGDATAAAPGGAADDAMMKRLEALGYLTPDNPDALNNLGQRYQKEGEYEKAIVEFEKALALRPNFAAALNNLGICYGHLKRYPEAERSFQRAIEVNPKDIFAMNNLAVIYLRTGRFDDARRYAGKALEIEPRYASAHFTLGSVYATLGQLSFAEREFIAALEIEPGNATFRTTLERLRSQRSGPR